MGTRQSFDIPSLAERIGEEIFVSDWITVSQEEIDTFGRVTRDCDPVHMNPAHAREHSPFGTTVLFGFQILAMLSHLAPPIRLQHASGQRGYDLNYGLNHVRFIRPIPVNVPFRNRVVLKDLRQREGGGYLVTTLNTIELQGETRPALVAEWIAFTMREPAGDDTGGTMPFSA